MTQYLLDTNIVYWAKIKPLRLSVSVRTLLENANTVLYYSVITPWELAIKQAKLKLDVPEEFYATLPGFCNGLHITEDHVSALRKLPPIHHDPFDRMLVAQAIAEKLTLITSDKRLAAYPVKTLLCGA